MIFDKILTTASDIDGIPIFEALPHFINHFFRKFALRALRGLKENRVPIFVADVSGGYVIFTKFLTINVFMEEMRDCEKGHVNG